MSTKEFYSMQDAHIICHADPMNETGLSIQASMSALPGLPLEPAMEDLLALLMLEQQQTERTLHSGISLFDALDPDDDDDEEYEDDDDEDDEDFDDDADDDEDDDGYGDDDDDDDEPYEEESDEDDM